MFFHDFLALKTIGYAGLFGGTVAAFGGIIYTLYTELQGTSGTYPMLQRAVSLIEADPKLMASLGSARGPLKVYGQANNYGRRRPHLSSRLLEDGKTHVHDATFFVEGSNGPARKAKVTLQVVEEEKGKLKERFLAVDVPGEGRIVLIQPPKPASNFLSRLFSWK